MYKQIKLGKNLCLDVNGGKKSSGTRFIAWKCHKGTNQKFKITRRGEIQAKHSKKCMSKKFRQVTCKRNK
jgi:hypothetical protein